MRRKNKQNEKNYDTTFHRYFINKHRVDPTSKLLLVDVMPELLYITRLRALTMNEEVFCVGVHIEMCLSYDLVYSCCIRATFVGGGGIFSQRSRSPSHCNRQTNLNCTIETNINSF